MKRALVVVDMIEDFVHEGGALYCGPSMARIIPVIQKEIARAHAAAEPVMYLTDNHLPGDAEFQIFPPHALAGTKGAEIVPELAPEKSDVVIPKRRYSGFFGTRHNPPRARHRHASPRRRLHQHLRALHRGGRAQPRLRRRGARSWRDLVRRGSSPGRATRAREDARSEDPPLDLLEAHLPEEPDADCLPYLVAFAEHLFHALEPPEDLFDPAYH